MRKRTSQFKAINIATNSTLLVGLNLLLLNLLFLNLLVFNAAPVFAADNPPRKIVSGWIPYYGIKNGLTTAIANQDLIKEVSPFWYSVKSATTITDQYAAAKLTDPMSVVLSGILGDDAQRASLITTITLLVRTNNFDGIDLDFENFAFTDGKASWSVTQPRWIQFVKELATALHNEKKLLFITSPVDFDPKVRAGGYSVYSWREIAPYIDRLRIMTYDYSTSAIGPIGPLPWVEDAIKYATSVVPASKVFIGVPGYGRDWVDSVSGTCPVEVQGTITTKAKAATFVMRDAANLAASYGATPVYKDKEGEVTFSYAKTFTGQNASGLPTTCTAKRVAWYQDSRSYVERAKLVAKYRLGGIVLWTMGMEDATTIPAVRAFAQTIAPDVVVSSLALDKKNAQFGDAINISTLFSLPDKQPIANLPIRIESKNSDGSWRRRYRLQWQSFSLSAFR
jgi:spore germination protein YaaH